jgi:hypothetical protein
MAATSRRGHHGGRRAARRSRPAPVAPAEGLASPLPSSRQVGATCTCCPRPSCQPRTPALDQWESDNIQHLWT